MALITKLIRKQSVVPAALNFINVVGRRLTTGDEGTYPKPTTLHGPGHAYETGQKFVHRLLYYQGIVLFSWWVRVENWDERVAAMVNFSRGSQDLEDQLDPDNRTVLQKYKLHYAVLVDVLTRCSRQESKVKEREWPFKEDDQAMHRTLLSYEWVDIVVHEDILPFLAVVMHRFCNPMFHMYFHYSPWETELTLPYIPTAELWSVAAMTREWLQAHSVLHCRATDCARLSVLPLLLGWQMDKDTMLNVWRFLVRVENRGAGELGVWDMTWSLTGCESLQQARHQNTTEAFCTLQKDATVQLDAVTVLSYERGNFRGFIGVSKPDRLVRFYDLPRFDVFSRGYM